MKMFAEFAVPHLFAAELHQGPFEQAVAEDAASLDAMESI